MSTYTDLADRYIATWNETQPETRAALVAETFSPNATYLDPVLQGEGHEGIASMIAAAQAQFPGLRFERIGKIDDHHDRLRFSWQLAPENGAPVVKGTDICTVEGDRLTNVLGFFDQTP